MNVLDQVRRDARSFVNGTVNGAENGGFTSPITLINDDEIYEINGLATVHSQIYDPELGTHVIGKNSNISFSEKDLIEKGAITRNANGEVILEGWIAEFEHEIGRLRLVLAEPQPDSSLGLIKCQLRAHE